MQEVKQKEQEKEQQHYKDWMGGAKASCKELSWKMEIKRGGNLKDRKQESRRTSVEKHLLEKKQKKRN